MCDYMVLIIYNLARFKVRVRIMLFGCSIRSKTTRLNTFLKVTLHLIAIAIANVCPQFGISTGTPILYNRMHAICKSAKWTK